MKNNVTFIALICTIMIGMPSHVYAQFSWQTPPPEEMAPRKGDAVEKVVTYTAVDDWGTVVKKLEVTVKKEKMIKTLTAADFDIQNNAVNSFYDPTDGQIAHPYTDDNIKIEKNGKTLIITARPFDAEGARTPMFKKTPWRVVCKNEKLNFSMTDVTETHTEVIDDCIRGSFTFAGLTREYMLYLPKDEHGNTIDNVPLFVWQIGGGEYNQPLMTAALANKCLASLPQHNQKCATLVFAIANDNYSYSASEHPERIELIDRNNALQMAFIDKLIEEGKIDGNRLFCAGASSGGGCTMRFMMQFANRFKAAIPICAMDPIVPIHMPLRQKPNTNMGEFTNRVDSVWNSNSAVYKWNGTDMVLSPIDKEAFIRLPMYFVHAQDDNTCNVLSSYIYRDARRRLGAKNDIIRIYSDDEMRAYGFGGMLSHFSWCRVLNDYGKGEAMDWLINQF